LLYPVRKHISKEVYTTIFKEYFIPPSASGGGALMKDLKITDRKLKKIASSIASIKVYGLKNKG